jgi:uncharacterized membrane protein YcaP (DUF421 family)
MRGKIMLLLLARTIILFFLVMITIRIMGKRQIGELQPFELVVTIIIAELATIPMEDKETPLINGIIPIITLLVLQVSFSYISLKNERIRNIICGTPSILVENGKIKEKELKKLRYNLSDLMEQLRIKNISNIADVEYAILETSGELSVITKSQKKPLTPEDLNISTEYEGLPLSLIMDGKIIYNNLIKANLDIDWLYKELKKHNIDDPKNILFASLDTKGNIYLQSKERGN